MTADDIPRYDTDPRDHDGEQLDLADRQALRRVGGLSTELQDVTEVEYRQLRLERVVLIGVWTEGGVRDAENSLAELAALAETAGSHVLEGLIQRRDRPDPATYVGSGKARELRDIVVAEGADTVICDGELTPGQLRQLEEVVKVKVIDRTAL
ncbi:MAG: GTPase HflX, partial [Actinomycetes bacterium]